MTSKVLALLAAFQPGAVELTLSELARRSGVSLSTAHRRAAELVEWGALERDPAGRYRIGLRLSEVASLAPRVLSLRDAAAPFLEDLYEVTHENVQLAVRDGLEVVIIERIAGGRAVPVSNELGGRFALHATGVGLVLLAYAQAHIQEQVLSAPLPRHVTKTIVDPEHVRPALADVRRRGYSVTNGLVAANTLSVGAPVWGPAGGVVAAVALVVPAPEARPSALAPLVMIAARGISRALAAGGGRNPPASRTPF